MLNLLLNELKLLAKSRKIKGYKNLSEERLLSALDESESAKCFDNEGINNIGKDFDNQTLNKIIFNRSKNFNKPRDRFSKPEKKEIRKNLHELEKKKDLCESETKTIENNFFELEKRLFGLYDLI